VVSRGAGPSAIVRMRHKIMTPTDHETDLVRRAVEGDRVALTVLLADSHAELRAYIARKFPRRLRTTVDPDDIVQETQCEAFRHIGGLEPRGRESFQRWLRTIGIHKLRNALRHQRALKRGGGREDARGADNALWESTVVLLDLMEASTGTPSRFAARTETIEAVQAALGHLSADLQQAVILVYIQGVGVAAAASQMGRSPRAIHNLCYQAKLSLRNILGARSRYLADL